MESNKKAKANSFASPKTNANSVDASIAVNQDRTAIAFNDLASSDATSTEVSTVHKKTTTPPCEENEGNASRRGSSDADNAEHVTVNEEEGVNITEIEENAAVINKLTITAVYATDFVCES